MTEAITKVEQTIKQCDPGMFGAHTAAYMAIDKVIDMLIERTGGHYQIDTYLQQSREEFLGQ